MLDPNKEALKNYLDYGIIEFIEVLGCPNSCKNCKEFFNKEIKIEEAISKNILPVKNCSNKKGCRCTYIPIVN